MPSFRCRFCLSFVVPYCYSIIVYNVCLLYNSIEIQTWDMCSSVQYLQETNDAAANDANEAIPEDQLDQMRALGMYGLMVCTLTGINSAE